MNLLRQTLAFIDRKSRDVPGDGIGGKDSGEGHVRGLMDRRKIRGGPPMGTESSTRSGPGPRTVIGGLDDRYS